MSIFLNIAISLAKTIGELHKKNIIYKHLNPANIVINKETSEVVLNDLDTDIQENLAYISPEQTGRTNRVVDYRTDFYSLGVILYELLIGQLPFQTQEPIEYIYCHLAQKPLSPCEVCHDIPQVLSDIIMKLLAKNPEERYQSAYGFIYDLKKCLELSDEQGKIDFFPIGSKDGVDQLHIPQKIFGRELEMCELMKVYSYVKEGNFAGIMVSGCSGLGKSMLINALRKPILEDGGIFLSGKFDQYKRNEPYSVVIQLIQHMIKQILTESPENVEIWKNKILEALGANSQVVIDLVPEMELIIGKQSPLPDLDPVASQNRFNLTFKNLFSVFCRKNHPLVVFINDWQWADSASLNIYKAIMINPISKYLLIIGAYREEEIDNSHPFMTILREIENVKQIQIKTLNLKPLHVNYINDFLKEALHCSQEEVKYLGEIVQEKTQGNPFYMIQFLKTLYHEKIIEFDVVRGIWTWEIDDVKKMGASYNVIDGMINRLRDLPQIAREVLQYAACIGNIFNVNTLSIIKKQSPQKIFTYLRKAVKEGFLISIDDLHYRFSHDKVQQAAYLLIPESEKKAIHYLMGHLLLSNTPKADLEEKIFNIVYQLNKGIKSNMSEVEKVTLIELNLMAGKKAKKSAAYQDALNYFIFAMEFDEENLWSKYYEILFDLHKEFAQMKYINGYCKESQALLKGLMKRAKTIIDKAELYSLLLAHYSMMAKYEDAIKCGREALKVLGMELPEKNLQNAFKLELAEAKKNLGSRCIASLIDEPEMNNLEKILAVKVLSKLSPAIYWSNRKLWNILVLKRVNLCLLYGNLAESAYTYTTYGITLRELGEYDAAQDFGMLGMKICEKWDDLSHKCRTYFTMANYLYPWIKHIRHSLVLNEKAYQVGVTVGELEFAGYACEFRVLNKFWQGKKLNLVREEISNVLSIGKNMNNRLLMNIIKIFEQVVGSLCALHDNKTLLQNEYISYEQYFKNCLEEKRFYDIGIYLSMKSQIAYLNENPVKALEYAQKIEDYEIFLLHVFAIAEYKLFYSLSLTALYMDTMEEEKEIYWEKLQDNQSQMKNWANKCEENFLHKYLLVEAEISRISGKWDSAIDFYDKAIESARENKFIQYEALANELAAKFYLSRGKDKIAVIYMQEAYDLYNAWGANSKVNKMKEKYFKLLFPKNSIKLIENKIENTIRQVDIKDIMRMSQAISSEIILERLIEKLLRIAVENTGAQTAFVIMESEGKLIVEGELSQEKVSIMQRIPLEKCQQLASSIVNYVARTKANIILKDAVKEEAFSADPYIIKNNPQSILCMPINYRGDLQGILYLENNLISDVFTQERYEFIKILSTQAAISIENAIMYRKVNVLNKKLARKVVDRTSALNAAKDYDKLKTEFFANISHELRTPVNLVQSAIHLQERQLNKNGFDRKNNKMVRYTSIIKQNSYRLVRLVNNLIDTTKIDAGFLKLNIKNCNIVNVIEDTTLSVVEFAKLKQIELIFDTDVEEKIIACDPEKIERIVLNLLSNAIKFTASGGRVSVYLTDKEEKVLFSVKDNGLGIPEEIQPLIFERFVQVDKSLSRKCEGSGIGLHIVKSLVEMHGGKISLNSKYGYGSEFIIEVPDNVLDEECINEENECYGNRIIDAAQIEFSDIYF